MRAFARETLSVTSGAAVALTNNLYNTSGGAAGWCRVVVEDASVRYWEDGTNPTTSSGIRLSDGDSIIVEDSATMSLLRFIAENGTAILQVEYAR